MRGCVLDPSALGYGSGGHFVYNGNELSGSVKDGEFLES
jgi:hypothetical protein